MVLDGFDIPVKTLDAALIYIPRGLMSKYHCGRGVSRSMMVSSNGNPNSSRAMCDRCAYGQRWLVYR